MPKFTIETHLTVVLRRTWEIEATDRDAALNAFEEDQNNAKFVGEEPINLIGDETVEDIVHA